MKCSRPGCHRPEAARGLCNPHYRKQLREMQRVGGFGALASLKEADWVDEAVCAETFADAFFPEKGEPQHSRAAKQICEQCPVRLPCLQFAVDNQERFGIWGGLSERERRRLEIPRRRLA